MHRPLRFLAWAGLAAVALVSLQVAPLSSSATAQPDDAKPRRTSFYVSPTGNDGGPGTIQRPWRTLRRALGALRPGQRVVVRAGVYKERLVLARDGTRAAPVQLVAQPGEHPVIAGRLKVTGDHVRVVGLVIDGAGAGAHDAALYIAGAQGVEIRGCEVRGAVGSGIFVGDDDDPSRDVSLLGNWIHDNGRDDFLDHGVYWAHGRGGVIGNNVIDRSAAFGLHLFPDADDLLVTQNTVVGSGRSGVIVAGDGPAAADRNLIVNNIVAFNGEHGIRSSWDGPIGSGNAVRNNLLHANANGDLPAQQYTAGLKLAGNRFADPQFRSRDTRNYRLSQSSPARDRAIPVYSRPRDIDGRERPQGAGPDLGAYEH